MTSEISLAINGDNPTRLWGMTTAERIRKIACKMGVFESDTASVIRANAEFVFDPELFGAIMAMPDHQMTLGGVAVLHHVADRSAVPTVIALENFTLTNAELRKREKPFVMRLTPQSIRAAERANYDGAYKGVTDVLTKYLWRGAALILTRFASTIGLSPNMITSIGLVLCILATFAFADGRYWLGLAAGLAFMVLDTVDGKLARCTIASSWWGNVYDHGIDLIHPPFWWWAWAVGLAEYGTPVSDATATTALIVIIGGYVIQRAIEGAFIAAFAMHIHVWQPIDSQFRLITARRNPNMLLLFAFLCFGAPHYGLIALAWWTAISCLFHLVRLLQAYNIQRGGRPLHSWLAEPA